MSPSPHSAEHRTDAHTDAGNGLGSQPRNWTVVIRNAVSWQVIVFAAVVLSVLFSTASLTAQDTTADAATGADGAAAATTDAVPAGEVQLAPAPPEDTPVSLVTRDPWLPLPEPVRDLSPEYRKVWTHALGLPELELKREAALALALAHREGALDCTPSAAALRTEVAASDTRDALRTDLARALIAIDDKSSAELLSRYLGRLMTYDQVVEPALAGWKFEPMRAVWLTRLGTGSADDLRRVPRYQLRLAIQGLTSIADPAVQTPLQQIALHAADRGLRIDAARSLGQIQWAGLESTARTLASSGVFLDRHAAAMLLQTHDSAAAQDLLEQLASDTNPAVAAEAWRRLAQLDNPRLVPLTAAAVASTDSTMRRLAVATLLATPDATGLSRLAVALADPHPPVRTDARHALMTLAGRPEFDQQIREHGLRMLTHESWAGREQATILLTLLDHEAAAERLLPLLSDRRPEVAVAAAWGLRHLAVADVLPSVLQHAESLDADLANAPPTTDAVLVHLFEGFGVTRFAPAEALLRRWVAKIAPRYPLFNARASAIWALGYLLEDREDNDLSPQLITIINDMAFVMPEFNEARYAASVTLGRMRAKSVIEGMRRIAAAPPLLEIRLTIGWGLNRIAGEPLLTVPPRAIRRVDWFLTPQLLDATNR